MILKLIAVRAEPWRADFPEKTQSSSGSDGPAPFLPHELTQPGFDVVAIERGPWRDTATDFPISYAQDELRYRLQHQLFLRRRRCR